ncbi:conserved hypothetical protein [Ricinus communis]|uniref:Uncharacterized protein n=1 Tax=Ricinus communis TaxID=3988 RepID=B9RZ82_RICCO|nr:conserved hypothetical protein [Ricinus communis]
MAAPQWVYIALLISLTLPMCSTQIISGKQINDDDSRSYNTGVMSNKGTLAGRFSELDGLIWPTPPSTLNSRPDTLEYPFPPPRPCMRPPPPPPPIDDSDDEGDAAKEKWAYTKRNMAIVDLTRALHDLVKALKKAYRTLDIAAVEH